METRSGRRASQHEGELSALIGLFLERGVTSYLEIGARHGDTFHEVMRRLPEGSMGVAVDLPDGPWGSNWSREWLEDAVESIRELGRGARAIFGDSADGSTWNIVQSLGPFDAVLIDADHRYEAVKADFERYKAPITALHDIDGHGLYCGALKMGVTEFWAEIRDQYEHVEIIDPADERPMGIGVVFT